MALTRCSAFILACVLTTSTALPSPKSGAPSLLDFAVPPAWPNAILWLSGADLGAPGVQLQFCAPSCSFVAPAMQTNDSVAFIVPGASGAAPALATVAACAPGGAPCSAPISLNAPRVTFIFSESDENSTATLWNSTTQSALPGSTIHVVGRNLAWGAATCDPLVPSPDPSAYSASTAAAEAARAAVVAGGPLPDALLDALLAAARAVPSPATGAPAAASASLVPAAGGASVALAVTLASCFRLDAELPAGLAPGDYELRLTSNGLAGAPAAGWLAGTVTVVAPRGAGSGWPVAPFGCASGDIVACVAAAQAAGGGVLQLEAREYVMPRDAAIVFGGGVQIVGAGARATTLVWRNNSGSPPAALIACTGMGVVRGLTVRVDNTTANVGVAFDAGSRGCRLEDAEVLVYSPQFPAQNPFFAGAFAQHFVARNVNLLLTGSCARNWNSNCFLLLQNPFSGLLDNVSAVAQCPGYSIDSARRVFVDRMVSVSIGVGTSEGQGFSSFGHPNIVEDIYHGRSLDIGSPASAVRNEAMTLDGPYGNYFGWVRGSATSVDGTTQALNATFGPTPIVYNRVSLLGSAASILGGRGIGQVSRVVDASADLMTYTVSPPFAIDLDANSSALSIVNFRGRSVWEGNAFVNATAFQLFGSSFDIVVAGQFFMNSSSGAESFGLYYQGGWQANLGILYDSNTLRCTGADPPYFFRFAAGLGSNSLPYSGCRICSPAPIPWEPVYNRGLTFRRSRAWAGTPMKILGNTHDVVIDGADFRDEQCVAGGPIVPALNLTLGPDAQNVFVR